MPIDVLLDHLDSHPFWLSLVLLLWMARKRSDLVFGLLFGLIAVLGQKSRTDMANTASSVLKWLIHVHEQDADGHSPDP